MPTAQQYYEKDLRVADMVDWPHDSFVADIDYPGVLFQNLWDQWLYYWLNQWSQEPDMRRRFCSVDLPYFTTNLNAARCAADLIDLQYANSDTAEQICDAILNPPTE